MISNFSAVQCRVSHTAVSILQTARTQPDTHTHTDQPKGCAQPSVLRLIVAFDGPHELVSTQPIRVAQLPAPHTCTSASSWAVRNAPLNHAAPVGIERQEEVVELTPVQPVAQPFQRRLQLPPRDRSWAGGAKRLSQ